MDKKEFTRFMIAYGVNLAVIGAMVAVLILASNGVIPSFFKTVGLVGVLADMIWFNRFSGRYRPKK